jgi:tetratricopeptide (TPR) repeat protein
MEEIKRQVGRAQRRLVLQQFLMVIGWSLFATLLIAVVGLAIPRLWVLNVIKDTWDWSWIGGGIAAGLLVASVWTYIIRRTKLDAAIELDKRFGLKERVSSTLALGPEELETEIGQALLVDAVRRVERIDVREQFQVSPSWRFLLPLAPAIALAVLFFLPSAQMKQAGATTDQPAEIKKQIKTATQKLQEKLRENQKKAEALDLKDAEALKEIDRELNKLGNKETADRKEALLKINDLSKEIEKRKQELGGPDKLKKEFDKLKDIEKGPADKMAEALKEGDFGKAQEEMKKLKEDLKNGKLNDEDKAKLGKQMEQLKERIQQAMQDKKEAKERLQQQIDQKLAEGKVGEAAKLQQQLDELEENDAQQQQMMQQLADKLGQCAECMKQGGDPKEAMEKLDQLAQDLQNMQEQLDQLENLNEVLDQLAEAKEAMKCANCQGEGCKECEGNGKDGKGGKGKGKGNGKGDFAEGEGIGEGLRDEEKTDKSFYDTKVASDPKAGESVRIGDAGGKNKAGPSTESVKEAVRASLAKDPDALEDVTLPRDQREHAKQFFDKFRKGE